MPLVLILALAGSLALHAVALFGTDFELPGGEQEPLPLLAELRPPPAPPPAVVPKAPQKTPQKAPGKVKKMTKSARSVESPEMVAASDSPVPALPSSDESAGPPEETPALPEAVEASTPQPVKPLLPASGAIRFAIYKESLGLLVGRAEHRWEFAEDGHYQLSNVTETSGLVSLFKPIRVRAESKGRLVAGGLQPDSYRTWKNGQDNNDGADFDWLAGQVHLARDGNVLAVEPGTQDLLSLTYQLAYLAHPEAGSSIGIVTVRKYQRYALEALGEEEIDIPAGHFRTLHLRTTTDTTTEIWIALDLHRLPVKIRYTDRKGDSFVQVATQIGDPASAALPSVVNLPGTP